MTTTDRSAGYRPREGLDQYGRRTYPALVTPAMIKKIQRRKTRFVHRTPNGFNDPITNYHLVEALLDAEPGQPFTAGQFAAWLNQHKPEIRWDSVTVGRTLSALYDYWVEANGEILTPLVSHRYYDGVFYETVSGAPQHKALANLLEDLAALAEETVEAEARGEMRKRLETPLNQCPSVMQFARAG